MTRPPAAPVGRASLGTLIRDARTVKRITLRELARRMGVSAPYLSDVEHDRRTLSIDRCADVAWLTSWPMLWLDSLIRRWRRRDGDR